MSDPQNQNGQNQQAWRLKNAQDRLGAAIERLDAVFEQESDGKQDVEIRALKSENAVLKGVLGQATSRLDTVIDKLKTRHNA